MKVFINKRNGGYSGGLAIVAANSAEEAHKTFCFNHPIVAFFDAKDNYCSKEEAVSWSCPYYEADGWKEVPYLTADVTEPCLIEEDGYTE